MSVQDGCFPAAFVMLLAVTTAAAACTGSQVAGNAGVGEPLVVESGQFFAGTLPGSPPLGSSDEGGTAPPRGAQVIDVNAANRVIRPGEMGMTISGHTTTDAQTVAVRFAGLGSGYWVVPVGGPDPTDNGLLTWSVTADFARDLPAGTQSLLFAAIDGKGASGVQQELPVCVDTPVPDNLNACDPTRAPPAAVLSLAWDTPVDLDLVVQTPAGAVVGGKNATTAAPAADGGANVPGAGAGVLDRDSNRDCAIDGIQREDVVWQSSPPSGVYQVWADLYSACGQASVRFTVSLWLAEAQPDGTQRLVEHPFADGELLAQQANAGSSPGLFVGDFILQ
jgi:hypothetical protein